MTNIEKAGGLGAGGVLAVALFFANGIEARVNGLETESKNDLKFVIQHIETSTSRIIESITEIRSDLNEHNIDANAHKQPLVK